MLVDSQWLRSRGLSRSRIHDYVASGWLERLRQRVYRRSTLAETGTGRQTSRVGWELAVASAQALVERPFHVGGATALDLLALSHFLDLGRKTRVRLYDAQQTAPSWLMKLTVDAELVLSRRQLKDDDAGLEWRRLELGTGRVGGVVESPAKDEPWDQYLRMSGAERATLEMLQEVSSAEGFQPADKLFEGLANLRPSMLARLLGECMSVKAKRLFFFFADRHAHAWARRLDPAEFDVGRGKRQIVKGGRLEPKYQITVPAELMPDGEDRDGG